MRMSERFDYATEENRGDRLRWKEKAGNRFPFLLQKYPLHSFSPRAIMNARLFIFT